MTVRLTFATAAGQRFELVGLWPSTWAALDTALELGAVRAVARCVPPSPQGARP